MLTLLTANHFMLTGSTRSDLKVTPFVRVKNNNPWVRLHLEMQFINKQNLIELPFLSRNNAVPDSCAEPLLGHV